ncbi:MAG: alpha/beta fold hydrolase [Bdellovibrionota bacterium]
MSDSSIVSRIVHETGRYAPDPLSGKPWWESLESNFWNRPEGFELGRWDNARVRATAALDVVSRTLAASTIGLLAMPLGFHPFALQADLKDRTLYEDMALQADPSRFFPKPPRDVRVRAQKPQGPHFRPKDGTCADLSFESPFEPLNPRIRKKYLRHRWNAVARARYWRHEQRFKGKPRPTIVAVHGFAADPYWLNEWFFALPWFYQMGCDVFLYTLPFHGRRRTALSPFSGHGYFSGGLSWMNETIAQSVFDFRIFVNYLEDQAGVEKIGVTGVSLGGFTSALLAATEPRLYFSIPNVPVVSIPDLVLEWEPVGTAVRSALFATGLSIKDIRKALAVAAPLTYKPLLPKERLFIIGGVGDRLAPPSHSRLLWDHWGRCRIHWFPGNHVVHLDKGAYLKEMAKFLTEIKFLEEPRN